MKAAATALERDGYLLPEDTRRIVERSAVSQITADLTDLHHPVTSKLEGWMAGRHNFHWRQQVASKVMAKADMNFATFQQGQLLRTNASKNFTSTLG